MSHTRAHPWNIRDLPSSPLDPAFALSRSLPPSSLTSISPVVRFTHRLCVCASAKRQGIISRGREAERQSCVAFVRARKGTREKERKLAPPRACNWWNAAWINQLRTLRLGRSFSPWVYFRETRIPTRIVIQFSPDKLGEFRFPPSSQTRGFSCMQLNCVKCESWIEQNIFPFCTTKIATKLFRNLWWKNCQKSTDAFKISWEVFFFLL